MQLRCGTPDIRVNTGDLCGLCQLRSALKRPFLARLSPRRGYQVPSSRLRRSEIAAPPTTAYREKQMRKVVQFGCSLCIIFASLLHACLALYVEQVNERKLVCVCVVHGKASSKPARSRHQQAFLGLVLTAARLLAPTKSATQAKRQHVLFG